jgi:hypothetical protein
MPSRPRRGRWLVYVAAFAFPVFGLAYGILEMTKPEAEHRRRGKLCAVLAVVATVLLCAGAVAYVVYSVKTGLNVAGP